MNPADVTFVTGNPNKARQLSDHLGVELKHQKLDLDEIQSLSLYEIVEHKAAEAFKHLGTPVLIEDASLVFNAMGNLPGPLIKWFYNELNNDGLCKMLDVYPDRGAVASVMFGLYDGKTLHTFQSGLKGVITKYPGVYDGFGYNCIFQPDGFPSTLSKLDPKTVSIRQEAFKALREFFNQNQ